MPRTHVSVRIQQAANDRLHELATEYDVTFTQVVRVCLAVALERPTDIRRVLEHAKRAS